MAYQHRDKIPTPTSSSTASSDEELSRSWNKGRNNSTHSLDGGLGKSRKNAAAAATTMPIVDPHAEDTDDASENEDNSDTRNAMSLESNRCIKEQMYLMKREELKNALAELEAGNHAAYKKGYKKLDRSYRERLDYNMACRGHEEECIDRYYLEETRAAAREFEDKKSILKESLITEYEDLIKRINTERFMELNIEQQEEKPVSTRRLRRRGANDPVPAAEKRRRITNSLSFRLDEKDVDDDIKCLVSAPQSRVSTSTQKKKQQASSTVTSASASSSSDSMPINVKVVNGKLFYEKIWFHRGQQVYVNSEDTGRYSGLISSINFDHVLVRNVEDQEVKNISISDLVKGVYAIHRRA